MKDRKPWFHGRQPGESQPSPTDTYTVFATALAKERERIKAPLQLRHAVEGYVVLAAIYNLEQLNQRGVLQLVNAEDKAVLSVWVDSKIYGNQEAEYHKAVARCTFTLTDSRLLHVTMVVPPFDPTVGTFDPNRQPRIEVFADTKWHFVTDGAQAGHRSPELAELYLKGVRHFRDMLMTSQAPAGPARKSA